jgi:hypothetical protein
MQPVFQRGWVEKQPPKSFCSIVNIEIYSTSKLLKALSWFRIISCITAGLRAISKVYTAAKTKQYDVLYKTVWLNLQYKLFCKATVLTHWVAAPNKVGHISNAT